MLKKVRQLTDRILRALQNRLSKCSVYQVVEIENWAIRQVGEKLAQNLDLNFQLSITHWGCRNSIVHFGSIHCYWVGDHPRKVHSSNKVVVTWFHVEPDDYRLANIDRAIPFVDMWHTSCELTRVLLTNSGVDPNKICVIPIGVDLKVHRAVDDSARKSLRERLGIKKNDVVIGSFQKDGIGWGEGLSPKYVKGPDIFCDVVELIAKKHPVFVLLTGPARGYVKSRLSNSNIRFHHECFDDPNEAAEYYSALDIYLISSRAEGGPKALMESMASGVPLVTTEVGMAPEMIKNGVNAFMTPVDDVEELVSKIETLINSPQLRSKFVENGFVTVQKYDWSVIATSYKNDLYAGLIND